MPSLASIEDIRPTILVGKAIDQNPLPRELYRSATLYRTNVRYRENIRHFDEGPLISGIEGPIPTIETIYDQ